jgi:hypothetical protein
LLFSQLIPNAMPQRQAKPVLYSFGNDALEYTSIHHSQGEAGSFASKKTSRPEPGRLSYGATGSAAGAGVVPAWAAGRVGLDDAGHEALDQLDRAFHGAGG